jgi:putative hydroxymethylpyrimidine transport system substrate-binding protein
MMRVEDWGVPLYNELVLVTSEERLTSDPEMVASVINLIKEGYLAAAADQARAIDILVNAFPETERAVEEQGIALLADLWTQPVPGFGILVPEDWAEFATWMTGHGLLPDDFSIVGAIGANLPEPATPVP